MNNKIYIISFNSIDHTGGLENVVKNHIENYSDKTKKLITVISREKSKSLDKLNINQKIIKSRDIKSIDKIFFINQIFFSCKVALFILKNIRKYKKIIIHVHGIEYSGLLILLNLFFKNCFLIITAHGSLFLERFNYLKNKSLYLLIFFPILIPSLIYDSIANIGAYKIICINSAIKKYFSKISFKNNIDVIYNGMNFIKQKKKKFELKKYNKKIYNAIIVGSTSIRKGLPLAVESINLFNNISNNIKIKLHIVGFKEFYTLKFVKHINKEYNKYIGVVNQQELFDIYKKMDFMILPSIYEGFPLTVLESLNFDLPFIVSKECKADEIYNYSKYGIIVNGRDKSIWREHISFLVKNIKEYHNNITNSDFSNFSWKNISLQNEEVYNKIIK